MSNGAQVRAGPSATYRVLRELGKRAQHSFAAIREPHELVVLHRFSKEPLDQAGAPHKDVPAPTFVNDEEMGLLLRDARCLMKHWHPNIARVRHVDLVESELSIATELIDGATLDDLLAVANARGAPLPLPLVARILVDVLGGLHGLHGLRDGINAPLGALHGELCPANVIVGKDGVARIVNVFRSRPAKIAAGSEALAYSAPEALDPEPRQDIRSDLYAVGVMLWETLTGKRLYDETDPVRIAQRQRAEDLIRPELPETSPFAKLADVALRALAFDPALRFRAPSEMAAEIRRVAGTRLAPGSAVAQSVTELLGDRVRARRVELDPQLTGARRRSESLADLEAPIAPVAIIVPAAPLEEAPVTHRPDEAVDLAWFETPGPVDTGVAAVTVAKETAKPPPKAKPATDTADTVPTAPPKKPKPQSDRKISAPKTEAMPKPLPPRVPAGPKAPPPLPARAKPAARATAPTRVETPGQMMVAAAPVIQVPAPLSQASLDDLPGPRASMVDVMDLIDELPPSSPCLSDADIIAVARVVPVSDRSLSDVPPPPAFVTTPNVVPTPNVGPPPNVVFTPSAEAAPDAAPAFPFSPGHASESVPAVVPADDAPPSDPSPPDHHLSTPGRTQRELVVSLRPDPPNRRRFVPLVVAITTCLGLLSIIALIFTMRASNDAHAGSPPPPRVAPPLLDPPSTQIVAPPAPAPAPTLDESPPEEPAAPPTPAAKISPPPSVATPPAAVTTTTTTAIAPPPRAATSPPPRVAPVAPPPPAPRSGKPKKSAYEPLGI